MIRRSHATPCLFLFLSFRLVVAAAFAQAPASDDELTQHLSSLRQQIDDASLDVERREFLALEVAATLDRSARNQARIDAKLARWNEAITILDDFNTKNPDQPRRREFELQAAVYRWAQARAWHDQHALFPADSRSPAREAEALDDAIRRLRSIVGGEPGGLFDNIRFRLAWALSDRAKLEDAESPTRRSRQEEALGLLKQPPSETGLAGFHSLLMADLLYQTGKLDEAARTIDLAGKADPAPPEAEVLGVLVPIMTSQAKYSEAKARVNGSQVEPAAKALLLTRIGLAELHSATGPKGEDRLALEADVFGRIQSLRALKAPETRIALAEWAKAGVEPDARSKPEVWDALAEGYDILGDADKAASLEEKAAVRAEQDGGHEAAAAYRLRGGGFLFQAGKYVQADALLERVTTDPRAGPSRPKAGLLQALARGRAVAAGVAEIAPEAYAQALERQLREFPDDPSSAEVRWLLGRIEYAAGAREKAKTLWTGIPVDSPRWIDARLALAQSMRQSLEGQLATGERSTLTAVYEEAAKFLAESTQLVRSRSEADQVELLLCEARLNLVPIVGRPQLARDAAEKCALMSLTPSQRYRSKLIRMIAFVALGRYVEAEREAHQHGNWAEPGERAALMDAVRLLDLSAANADSDLLQRRFGLVLRLLVQPLVQDDKDESFSAEQKNELTFRLVRALLFLGDERGAQSALHGWTPSTQTADDRLLRDLADMYSRLNAHALAIDVQRLRIKKLVSASPAWFDARYGLALAYYRLERRQDALQLIEGTAILHPELGGGQLQEKFIRLRQRLSSPP